jgi:excisionase family DNA binding protein
MESSPGRIESFGYPAGFVCAPPLETQTLVEPRHDLRREDATLRHPAFLSVKDVAAYLGVSYNSVLGAIKNGSLPAYRFGPRSGTYRIAVGDLRDYVGTCRTGRKPGRRSENRKTGSKFKKLDAERLLNAWRGQGVLPDSPEE